jgi:lipopolysaccharide exporter
MGLRRGGFGALVARGRRMASGSFARGLTILTSTSLVQTLITFAAAPVLSRMFSPEQFGIAALLLVVAAIPTLAATGQYYVAFGIARNGIEAVNIAALSLLLLTLLSLAMLPTMLALRAHADLLPGFLAPVAPYFWTVPGLMAAVATMSIYRVWEIRLARYRSMVGNRLLETAGMNAIQIGLGLIGAGALGLILGRLLGVAAAAVHGLVFMVRPLGWRGLRGISQRRVCTVARRHWRFPAYHLPAQSLGVVAQHLTPILLGALYSLSSVGFFWFASRLLARPGNVFGGNVARVYFQHAADRRRAREPVFGLFWRSTGLLLLAGIVPFGAVMAYGPPLFAFVFGAEWETAGHYARWIALSSFVALIASPSRSSTSLFGLQGFFAVVEGARAVTGALVLISVAMMDGDEVTAIAATAAVQSLFVLGFIGFVAVRLRRLNRQLRAGIAVPPPAPATDPPGSD